METSAKTGMNAQELFAEAAKLLYKDYTKYKNVKAKKETEQLKPDSDEQNNNKKGCCK